MMGEYLGDSRMLVAGGLDDQPLEYWAFKQASYIYYVMKIVAPAEYDPLKHPELRMQKDLIADINTAIQEYKVRCSARSD